MKEIYLLLLFIQTTLAVAVQYVLKKLATDSHFSIWPPNEFVAGIVELLTTPLFWGAMVFYGVSLMMWLSILSRFAFSLAIPLAVGLNFTMVSLVGALFFHERMTWPWVVGVTLIFAGIVTLAMVARIKA